MPIMKKLYISIIVFAFSFSAAFSQMDIGITTITNPAPGSTISATFNDTMEFYMQNFGPDIPGTDTVYVGFVIDNVAFPAIYSLPLGSTFPSNAVLIVTAVVDLSALNFSDGTHTICATTVTFPFPPGDADLTNDSTCANYWVGAPPPPPPPPVGIESRIGSKSSIFLNNGTLNIDVANEDIVESTMLTVYSMSGALVHAEDIGGTGSISSKVNLSNQVTGVYVVRLVSQGKLIETQKLMK